MLYVQIALCACIRDVSCREKVGGNEVAAGDELRKNPPVLLCLSCVCVLTRRAGNSADLILRSSSLILYTILARAAGDLTTKYLQLAGNIARAMAENKGLRTLGAKTMHFRGESSDFSLACARKHVALYAPAPIARIRYSGARRS